MEYLSNIKHFSNWNVAMTSAGHTIEKIELEHVVFVGEKKYPLFILFKPSISIKDEKRVKSNEIVITRPSTYHTLVWCKSIQSEGQDRILLIKEFRSTAQNTKGFVYELPAGSAKSDFESERRTAVEELKEETGLTVNMNDLIFKGTSQQAPTVVAQQSTLYCVRISEQEMDNIVKETDGKTFGVVADTEVTHVCVTKVDDIMNPYHNWYGWELRGMIAMRNVM